LLLYEMVIQHMLEIGTDLPAIMFPMTLHDAPVHLVHEI
jgi:hypothetical protein